MEKPISEIVMASLSKKPEMEIESESGEMDPSQDIASDAMAAIKENDPVAFCDSMKALFDHFGSQSSEEME